MLQSEKIGRRGFIKYGAAGLAAAAASVYYTRGRWQPYLQKLFAANQSSRGTGLEDLVLVSSIQVKESDALIVVDLQNDFMPSGALGVEEGDRIVPGINILAERFHSRGGLIVMTQDWHPPGHLSFASSHGKKPFEPYESGGVGPVLWPDHCIQGTIGAEFHPDLETEYARAIIRKGYHPTVDSYSTFIENDKKTPTGLSGYLKELGKRRVFLCGLALDYCVYFSAVDGRDLGFEVVVVIDLVKAIDSPPGHLSNALDTMARRGVQFIISENLIF
ncbi:MAG: bifunctional nicotinamidase/pyrazinamidase [Candidatus Bathyarchaeia archaeon]